MFLGINILKNTPSFISRLETYLPNSTASQPNRFVWQYCSKFVFMRHWLFSDGTLAIVGEVFVVSLSSPGE
jgi:hypothetical protein